MEPRADTLIAYNSGKPIFTSNGKWLYPIFELEGYLSTHSHNADDIHVEDTVVGKAAAILFCRLGINSLEIGTLSRMGAKVLKRQKAEYKYENLVDRIFCQTEELLEEIDDFDEAYALLRERAGK